MTQGISNQFIDQLWETTCVAVPVDGTLSRRPSFFVPLLLDEVANVTPLVESLRDLGASIAPPPTLDGPLALTVDSALTWSGEALTVMTSDVNDEVNALSVIIGGPPFVATPLLSNLQTLDGVLSGAFTPISTSALWAFVPVSDPTTITQVGPALLQAANQTAATVFDVNTLAGLLTGAVATDLPTAEAAAVAGSALIVAVLAYINANAGAPIVAGGPFATLQEWRVAQGIP